MAKKPLRRAALYIDGNNWFHSLKGAGVDDRMRLDYAAISNKLVGAREWCNTNYYIGQVKQQHAPRLYAEQRRFLAQLEEQDPRINCCLGRLEPHPEQNVCAEELLIYLHSLRVKIDLQVFHDLEALAHQHRVTQVTIEKAVDVHLAVDLVMAAQSKTYDDFYILSCDGDYTPAVAAARSFGAKVFAASPGTGAELARAVDTFIPLRREWFNDCYLD